MALKNGKTQKISGRLDKSGCEDKSKRLGCFRGSSESDGDESVRTNKANSPREDTFRQNCEQGEGTSGKIMERLSLIEDAFISYVQGHQQQLQETLDESKIKEKNFLGIINRLKQDVYDFVSSDIDKNSQE
ncbi:MAG: hypothetical protein AAF915_01970 [Cyanobacteria bacterium P01_D01_bin.50]